MNRFCIYSLVVLSVLLLSNPAQARVKVKKTVSVNASIDTVWTALMNYQKEEKKFHKTLVSEKGNQIRLKEEFLKVPVVGNAYINYVEENHKEDGRVDYKLEGSKVLTKFQGTWKVEADENNAKPGTIVTLTTDIDTWVPVPFKNSILKRATMKCMNKRLAFVKQQAELSQN